MKERRWYYFLPLAGIIFGIWYIRIAFYDVVYSDYIRLVNNYLPDVWNPSKFLVPDILTRVPLSYLGRVVNTVFFHYSVTFDQILGVVGLGLSGMVLASYCIRRRIGAAWMLVLMAVVFSLNKWEMLTNGTGWVHFFAFAGFYYHYLVLDRVWGGQACPGDRRKLLWLPSLLILCAAGQYCAIYAAVLFLAYLFRLLRVRAVQRRWDHDCAGYLLAVLLPFGCYLLSNAFAVEDHAGMQDVTLIGQLLNTPSYFVRFLLKSLSSSVVGLSYASSHFRSETPYMVLGFLVAAAYLAALCFQYRYRLWERTILPLLLILSGGASHLLVLLARWRFLQYAAGVLGILLTCALVWKAERGSADGGHTFQEGDRRRAKHGRKRLWVYGIAVFITAAFLGGAVNDTRQELQIAPYRKLLCMERAGIALDFENRTDDELRENFEYRTSRPESGRAVRSALKILKENGWNVFHEK